jgi:hypothetical protein
VETSGRTGVTFAHEQKLKWTSLSLMWLFLCCSMDFEEAVVYAMAAAAAAAAAASAAATAAVSAAEATTAMLLLLLLMLHMLLLLMTPLLFLLQRIGVPRWQYFRLLWCVCLVLILRDCITVHEL